MIELRGVSKRYGNGDRQTLAVDDASFKCEQGEFMAITGHSGSGKSTLLSLIGGLARPDSGEIVVCGANIMSLDDDALSEFRNRKINFIFQFASLISTLSVLDNVTLPAFLGPAKAHRTETKKEAIELLRILGMTDKAASYPSQLSGGQQRRVAIARAFINNPQVVLADEPTGDLDSETEAEVIGMFKRVNEERGITFILVTHNATIASQATRMLKMNAGRLGES